MRFLVPAKQVLDAAKLIEESEVEGWVFDGGPVGFSAPELPEAPPPIDYWPKVYQRTPPGGKIRVLAVVCTACGHENEMKDMEFEPG